MIKIKKIFFVISISLVFLTNVNAAIKDGLFATVGNKAITKSDILNEMKLILILNNMNYSEDIKADLERMAARSTIKRTIREIEISKYDFLEYSKSELKNEITKLANKINIDFETLKNICLSNGLEFSIIEDQMKTELLWNSLIFYLYKDRLSINLNEIDEQLKMNQNKEVFEEFLISEIVIEPVESNLLESKINDIKNKIDKEGFENVAISESISQSAVNGGDLGWLNENDISKKFKSKITSTPIGGMSEPILLNEGVLIFKVRDKRKVKNQTSLEDLKEQLVLSEKSKILNTYSMSHYENLKRSISIKLYE